MKKNVKKHTDGVWYYAVVRWDGYGVFTSWDRAREECDGYSDNKKKKFKTFEEAKAYAEDRIVKNVMKAGNPEGKVSQDFFGRIETPFKLINNKVIIPSAEEQERNPRSRSAKLRIAEKK